MWWHRSVAPSGAGLQREEVLLGGQPTGIGREGASGGDHAVAGQDDAQGVSSPNNESRPSRLRAGTDCVDALSTRLPTTSGTGDIRCCGGNVMPIRTGPPTY